ncbi:MAG: FGGY family carbohydrate kinase [Pedobacter sp.]|uniref:FGGY-family carbohydrate kinase n=1 Tax=Pedobacter sp. TaxID=1411316 RepID=UPI002807D1F4|nr:FGGY family carbohydrate kinase [Pedobacter sp.]MDQ8005544.1 FGGY family carbohydrate kinase [Pedobacter sp.]
MKEAYLVVDIGTGNARVAVIAINGEVLGIQTQDIQYHKDSLYPDALYFDPAFLWQQIKSMSAEIFSNVECKIIAVTATSQREGIVLVDKHGIGLIGLPNIDHRGREWEGIMTDKDKIYQLTGRYPTSLFSALKIVGVQQRKSEIAKEASLVLSISDWVEYAFSGVPHFEHSHASETLLYEVQKQEWSTYLSQVFGIDLAVLPPLVMSGTILGAIQENVASEFGINSSAVVVVGGADTQLAAKSTQPLPNDVIIVSGTTTPIIKISENYETDHQQRTWTGRHTEPNMFMVETNAGVTGLNYQRLKEVFYPNESYELMEEELSQVDGSQCVASLGSLVASEKSPILKGGFIFDAPVSHTLKRADFVFATLWDIACSIKENYDCLNEVAKHEKDYVLACGGGVQSKKLRQLIANLIGKKVLICDTYRQSSAIGGALICNKALGKTPIARVIIDETHPVFTEKDKENYEAWKKARKAFKEILI